jgi:hypothetical protein
VAPIDAFAGFEASLEWPLQTLNWYGLIHLSEAVMKPHNDQPSNDMATAWKGLYELAMMELDIDKVPARIVEARRAMFDRAEEILKHSVSDEHRSIHHALKMLRRLEEVTSGQDYAA